MGLALILLPLLASMFLTTAYGAKDLAILNIATPSYSDQDAADFYLCAIFLYRMRALQSNLEPDRYKYHSALNAAAQEYAIDKVDGHFVFWKKHTGTLLSISEAGTSYLALSILSNFKPKQIDDVYEAIIGLNGKKLDKRLLEYAKNLKKSILEFVLASPSILLNLKGVLHFGHFYGTSEFVLNPKNCAFKKYLKLPNVNHIAAKIEHDSNILIQGVKVYSKKLDPLILREGSRHGLSLDLTLIKVIPDAIFSIFNKLNVKIAKENKIHLVPVSLSSSGLFSANPKLVGHKNLQKLLHIVI